MVSPPGSGYPVGRETYHADRGPATEGPVEDAIRAVLFDAGNTLVRVRGSVGGVYAGVARRHGLPADPDVLDRHFRAVFAERKEGFLHRVSHPHTQERERAWWRGLVREVFRRAGLWGALGGTFPEVFDDLYAAFARPEHWEVFPDVAPCLRALEKRGVAAGIVSNWDSRLHRVLAGLGLAERFRFVLVSAEFGAEKPDPAIFREAVRRLDLRPAEVLHVGDLYRDDVLGARSAGLRAALVDRAGNGCPAEPCLGGLTQVEGLLAG